MNKDNVCAGIVLYNPNIERLNENINAISSQVNIIYLINNGSKNTTDIAELIVQWHNVMLINLNENKGIATALNVACDRAIKDGYEWILTLDQDSVSKNELIETYLKFTNLQRVGQLTCIIEDRNSKEITSINGAYIKIDWSITSGSLVCLKAWETVQGFDEKLFIDGVDFDFGLKLSEYGFETIKINYIGLLHEVGKISKVIKIFGKEHQVFNHNKIRRYYICRNNIYIARKHSNLSVFKIFLKTFARIWFVFIFEDDKFGKLKAGFKGIKDGFKL